MRSWGKASLPNLGTRCTRTEKRCPTAKCQAKIAPPLPSARSRGSCAIGTDARSKIGRREPRPQSALPATSIFCAWTCFCPLDAQILGPQARPDPDDAAARAACRACIAAARSTASSSVAARRRAEGPRRRWSSTTTTPSGRCTCSRSSEATRPSAVGQRWRSTQTPFLFATSTSILPSRFTSSVVTCVPTPLSSSIKWGTKCARSSPSRRSSNQ
jgi:hypothetical protein